MGGEIFELKDIRPLNYIIGSLGSGKILFAPQIADSLLNSVFLGLERLEDENREATINQLSINYALKQKFEKAMTWLSEEGAKKISSLNCFISEYRNRK